MTGCCGTYLGVHFFFFFLAAEKVEEASYLSKSVTWVTSNAPCSRGKKKKKKSKTNGAQCELYIDNVPSATGTSYVPSLDSLSLYTSPA